RSLALLQRAASPLDAQLLSPMPGAVCVLNVQDGQQVQAGDVLLAVEAMKMEHEITAPADGTVKLLVGLGDQLTARQPVAQMHYAEAAEEG
ncbi:acetyl-CoA carboxylase biotin carboxyl carrier protein subunit, partial [Arthrobacter sp. JCM 19049]